MAMYVTDTRRRRVPVAMALLVLGAGSLVACTSSATRPAASSSAPATQTGVSPPAGGIAPTTAFTALTLTTLTTPAPVPATDRRVHLAYELLLTNAVTAPVTVTEVDVRDAATHASLLSLTQPALSKDATPLAGTPGDESTDDPGTQPPPITIRPATTWVVWLDVTLPTTARVPAHLEHRVVGSASTPAGTMPIDELADTIKAAPSPPAVLSPPVAGGTWYMSEGCCSDDTHHRRGLAPLNGQLQVPQRFAIDFYKLDDQHRTWVGDPHQLSSYLSYRQPILASADGTVVDATDRFANSTSLPAPPPIPPIAETVGNHVIEQIGPGTYVLYAHMDPGSVKVHTGSEVHRGQQLGLIGTSGNSTTPHLHFQLLSTATFFPSDSEPYVFDQFRLLGSITERLWDDNLGLQPSGTLPFAPDPAAGNRRDQLPLDRTVVTFPS